MKIYQYLLLNFLSGLGVLLGLEPFNIWIAGLLTPLSFLLLIEFHKNKNYKTIWVTYLLSSF
ncbi:MAG: hypothetical protein KDK36_08030, partial [Leptospiraceae bacterium]|nr:hypothetical protein [Leptospiraceae bacterium]